mgnify:CR=1 FL=1
MIPNNLVESVKSLLVENIIRWVLFSLRKRLLARNHTLAYVKAIAPKLFIQSRSLPVIRILVSSAYENV